MLYNINDYRHVQCKQVEAGIPVLNALIKDLAYKMVCTTGCPWYDKGNCPGYKEIKSKVNKSIESMGKCTLTNAQIAGSLGITTRQVTKLRKAGNLNALLLQKGLIS